MSSGTGAVTGSPKVYYIIPSLFPIGSSLYIIYIPSLRPPNQGLVVIFCYSQKQEEEELKLCTIVQNTKLGKEGKNKKRKKICRSYLSLALYTSLVLYSKFWTSCLRPKYQVPKTKVSKVQTVTASGISGSCTICIGTLIAEVTILGVYSQILVFIKAEFQANF
jgi:hypothetical protein